MELPIRDRTTAGRALARALAAYGGRDDLIVLALPRGGVPVACEVAAALGAPLDLMLVRKLGVPGQPELAMGAVASGGTRVLNPNIIQALGIREAAIERVAEEENRELERREAAYRGARPRPAVADRCVFLVDDGLATGATMRAAIAALRQLGPARVVVVAPIAPADTVRMLGELADEVVCLATPEPFMAIGQWYEDFTQVSDAEVRALLQRAWARESD